MEKRLVGIVIYNSYNQYLLTKTRVRNFVDYGMIGGEIDCNLDASLIRLMLKQQLGINLKENELKVRYLNEGEDQDGKYIILSLKLDEDSRVMKNLSNSKMEFMWVSMSKIVDMHKEKRLNNDQLAMFVYCEESNKKFKAWLKNDKKKEKESKLVSRMVKSKEKELRVPTSRDLKIADKRLIAGRCIKTTDKDPKCVGPIVLKTNNHSSIENFESLLNDEEFLIESAKVSPNPSECENYFYDFVNKNLKNKKKFRINFLKALYLNDNVFTYADIEAFVEKNGFESENEELLHDKKLRAKMIKRLKNAQTFPKFEDDDKSNKSEKEYRKQKAKIIELNKLKEKGLTEIIKRFNEKLNIEEDFTFDDFTKMISFSKNK